MVLFEVIPIEVVFAPTPGVGHASKTTRVVWLVLLGSKLPLTEGIVIAQAGLAMTAGHIKFFNRLCSISFARPSSCAAIDTMLVDLINCPLGLKFVDNMFANVLVSTI